MGKKPRKPHDSPTADDHQPDAANGMPHDTKTVFVRNVPYTMDASALQQLFANDVGPVRNAFLVSRKGDAQHAGYGYVQFALPQDAARATQLYTAKRVQGRKLQVQLVTSKRNPHARASRQVMPAQRRAPLEERKRKRSDPAPAAPAAPKPSKRPKSAPPSAEASALLRTVAVAAPAPIDGATLQRIRTLVNPLRIASVTDPVPADLALRCKLQQDGAGPNCILLDMGSVRDALKAVSLLHRATVPGGALWARQAGGEALHRKKFRLIVRNLPFSATEQQLVTLASTVAFPWEVTLPRNAQGTPRGFAFVGFMSRGHAQRAIDTLNGRKVGGRPIAVDWAVAKQQHQAVPQEEEEAGSDMDASDVEGSDGDFDREAAAEGAGSSAVGSIVDQVLREGGEADEQDAEVGEGDVDAAPSEEEEEAAAAPPPTISNAPSVDNNAACTAFVRGLPLDATSRQLSMCLGAFGRVTSCRLVRDKAAGGQLKGTAFVEFASADGVHAAVAASDKARAGTGPAITVAGRMISVHAALSGQQARDLATARGAGKEDRRRLHLAKEGVIVEGSPAWLDLSKGDQIKRKRAAAEIKAKLASPNYVVSATRLAVRNLPKSLDDKALKQLFLRAVKARAPTAQPVVRQAKVLREADRTTADGTPRSRGIGFVEFAEHEHALCALRQLNNNPEVFGAERRPIVEFAIDSVKALKAREARKGLVDKSAAGDKGKGGKQGKGMDKAARAAGDKGEGGKQGKGRDKAARAAGDKGEGGKQGKGRDKAARAAPKVVKPAPKEAAPPSTPEPAVNARPIKKRQHAAAEEAPARKKRPYASKGVEREDAFDDMVARYKAAMFGAPPKKAASKGRWFDA